MRSEENEIDKKVNKLSRKTNLAIMRKEISFDNQIKKLDAEIQDVSRKQLKDFDNQKELYYDYITMNTKDPSIERFRKKLNEM